jgi:hypothetical protein
VPTFADRAVSRDRLRGLVVRVRGYRCRCPGSILGATTQPREYN